MMSHSFFMELQSFYQDHPDLVLFLDESWEILWSNKPYGNLDFRKQPAVMPDLWKNQTFPVYTDAGVQDCELFCNQTAKLRIAILHPCTVQLPIDTTVLAAAAHSLTTACDALHNLLDEKDLYDDLNILNTITGDCYRIYRYAFLQQIVDRLRAQSVSHSTFSLNQALQVLEKNVHSQLRSCAVTFLELCEEMLCVHGTPDIFTAVLLSGLILSCQAYEKRQQIHVALERQNTHAVVTVSVTSEANDQHDSQIQVKDFGSLVTDKELLNIYCQVMQGSWNISKQGKTSVFRLELPLTVSHTITLSSGSAPVRTLFEPYAILLAPIHYHTFTA